MNIIHVTLQILELKQLNVKIKVCVFDVDIAPPLLTRVRLMTRSRSALQSLKLQLLGMS